jgi:adenylate kinase family enzyme
LWFLLFFFSVSFKTSVRPAKTMAPIHVFVAYADSFVGKQVLSQFQQFPDAYHIYGCTWDSAAAEKLNATAGARANHVSEVADMLRNAAAAAAAAAVATDGSNRSLLGDSRDTLTPCEFSRTDAVPLQDEFAHGGVGGGTSVPEHLSGCPAAAPASPLTVAAAASSSVSSSATFFSRHDVAATRAALLACDWIVVELRQSQTVLEMVRFLQLQSSFVRPKRLVLLSSLMTWYATPALTAAAATTTAGDDVDDGDLNDGEAAAGQGEKESEGDVEAPYPATPPQSLEHILRAAQEAASHAVVDAMRGSGSGGADDSGVDNAEGDGTGAAAAGAVEVLTEDQYNRRVPHLQYMSWRDAEKAVAAAHHAKGLPLDTFVVCSGLPYGGEEDSLEPLFRLAWSAQPGKAGVNVERGEAATTEAAAAAAAAVPSATAVLPIFGDGTQRVPLVHAQDLACFVRKLLRCPTAQLPFPERRYVFATDGANTNSWMSIVSGVNRMFGGRCALQPVPPSSYPLYRDVEKFTLDLRVDAETMKALMERQDDQDEGEEAAAATTTGVKASGVSPARLPNTWVAEGGLHRHLRTVAHEFAEARGVDPLRICLVGPPLVGKTYLASRLARYYRLPCVSVDSVVAEYKAALHALRTRMETTKAAVLHAERTRRLGIKRRRVLQQQQREWDAGAETADAEGNTDGGDGGAPPPPNRHEETGDAASSNTGSARGDDVTTAQQQQQQHYQQQREVAASVFDLTPAEEDDVARFVQDWWAEQPQVQAWTSKAAEMERVLLLRLHPRPATPDANPKRRAAGGKKKTNAGKDAQRSKEEEEELQQLKASLQNAPFQSRALNLMLRWRLAQPDCCVQGFVLDGVPATLELARMVFCEDSEENRVQPPATEEEALKPCYAATTTTGGASSAADSGGEGAAVAGGDGSAAGPATASEAASDARLPDHVVVLQASDTYLLSRLRAMGVAAEQQQHQHMAGRGAAAGANTTTTDSLPSSPSPLPTSVPIPVDVETFHQDLQTYKREYEEATYSVLSYWECAAARSGSTVKTTERRAEVHLITVEGHEPLMPPPPPASAFAEVPLGDTEQLLRQVIIGPPHNFGKSLEEVQRDAVRQRCLQEEREKARAAQAAAQAAAEATVCAEEQSTRAAEDEKLDELKKADLAELEARKQPLTRYLQDRVLPLLHKGLLEVCATRPDDPVDFLAEWLIRHNPHDDTFCDI